MKTVEHLARLVAFDTQNPPRDPVSALRLHDYASEIVEASGFVVERRDLGEGCAWLHARRGKGGVLVNVHTDTVPRDPAWTRDPFTLLTNGDRAVGLGACDTKGALAAYLCAAERTSGPAELLLTSDEEAGTSKCVRTFVQEHDVAGREIVVAEPTQCRAVLGHRGIGTSSGTFHGVAGHASSARALDDSANHEAVRWAARALEYAARRPELRFNLGIIEGGVKANMIASSCKVRFGVRPPSGTDPATVVDEICALVRDPSRATWSRGFLAPPLPAPGRSDEGARTLAEKLGVDVGEPVDFFTEAAFFSEAGAHALVLGSGDIAQAHTADEWVRLEELATMERIYVRILGGTDA